MKTTISLFACLGLMLASPAAVSAAKFYKWTDAQGVTHYSEDPPPESATSTSEVKVPTRLPSGSQPANKDVAPAKKDDKAAKKDDKAKKSDAVEKKEDAVGGSDRYAERCKQWRANIQTMEEHPRVKVSDEKGESRVLTEEEKDARKDEIQRQIKAFCE